jgi:hypothetical protein
VRTVYLDLVDYLAIAAEVTGLDVDTLSRVTQLNLAGSALRAPTAGWSDEDLYRGGCGRDWSGAPSIFASCRPEWAKTPAP